MNESTSSRTIRLEFRSRLAAPAPRVWAHAATFAGVNRELWPLHLSGSARVSIAAATPTNTVLVRSVLSLFGILPIDLHSFRLLAVWQGLGFHESSHSLLQCRWVHVRTIEPLEGGGCTVTDQLELEPRLLPTLTGRLVALTFTRRHERLRRLFGELSAGPALPVG